MRWIVNGKPYWWDCVPPYRDRLGLRDSAADEVKIVEDSTP